MSPIHAFLALATGRRQPETANDRFHRRSEQWPWIGVLIAVALHFGLFVLAPEMSVADMSGAATIPLDVVPPPEVQPPEPPPDIVRPALPVPSIGALAQDITIAETSFDANPVSELDPPATSGEDTERFRRWVPTMTAPRVLNADDVEAALRRVYPPLLRDAGIGGTVGVLLWVDESGDIERAAIGRSSGHAQLDEAALRVVDVMRLAPALNRDRAVAVLVKIPVVFEAR
ncbi:MAG: energy transducer TonB [Longimicrobiales bacterium]